MCLKILQIDLVSTLNLTTATPAGFENLLSLMWLIESSRLGRTNLKISFPVHSGCFLSLLWSGSLQDVKLLTYRGGQRGKLKR